MATSSSSSSPESSDVGGSTGLKRRLLRRASLLPWGRLLRVDLVELPDKLLIEDVPGRYPRSFLRTVSFPIHEVLQTSSSPMGAEQTIDREDRAPVDESGRRRGSHIQRQGAFVDRLDPRDMKGGMDPWTGVMSASPPLD